MKRVWFLTISTFRAVDSEASHYYGRIRSRTSVVDVEQKRLGTTLGNTIRFETEGEVINAAKKWFKKHGLSGEMLILARPLENKDVILATKRRAKRK